MSREYAENRIREALKLAKGNPTKARQQVIAWTFEDTKLLQALVRPHLTGIVAHALNRVIHNEAFHHDDEQLPEMPQTLNMDPDSFGKEILSALQSANTALFGREGSAPPVPRKKASQSHVDALKQIAKKKRDDR